MYLHSIILLIVSVISLTCQGEITSNLIVFDSLPFGKSLDDVKAFDIRTNFSGTIRLVESRDFKIVVNVTSHDLKEAYKVKAELFEKDNRIILQTPPRELSQVTVSVGEVNLIWLFCAFGLAAVLVAIFTLVYALKWYKQEIPHTDYPDHKSTSSQHDGTYRSRNSIPMVLLPNLETFRSNDNSTNDLRSDEEIAEEEEAEALEMSKELLKDKKAPIRKTQKGLYESVPTDSEDTDSKQVEEERYVKPEFGKLVSPLQVKLVGIDTKNFKNQSRDKRVGEKDINITSKSKLNTEPTYANETEEAKLIVADIHKTGQHQHVDLSKDKLHKSGNIYSSPPTLSPVSLSTFGENAGKKRNQFYTNERGVITSTGDAIYEDIARKYNNTDSFDSQKDRPMSDISELNEDDLNSLRSRSLNSTSMYGSSEIFDANDIGNTYFNLDSDLEIPPLEDDIFSEGVSSPGIVFPKGMSDKSKVNDDIKLIPGALKSPGPNTGRLVGVIKPRPYSGVVLRKNSKESDESIKRLIKDKSLSPPLPPPPENPPQQENVFEFPPPPPLEFQSKNSQGEYVEISGERTKIETAVISPSTTTANTASGKNGGSSSAKGLLGPKYLNMTMLTTLTIIALCSAGLTLTDTRETRVDITVYAPPSMLTNASKIFLQHAAETDVVFEYLESTLDSKSSNLKPLQVYDLYDPLLSATTTGSCTNMSCDQGCDESSGLCVCFKGYKLNKNGRCVDVNECREGKARCDETAGCYNKKGSYECVCMEDYYGDGKTCRECKEPCPVDQWEYKPCAKDQKKVCLPCTTHCPTGHYMGKVCEVDSNSECRVCQPKCGAGQYESTQCSQTSDRECKDLSKLVPPKGSPNVVLEDMRHTKTTTVTLEDHLSSWVGLSRERLIRGSGISVNLTVKFSDPTQRFVPTNITQPFDLQMSAPSVLLSHDVQRYCPDPIPDYYILRYKKHKDLTYKQKKNGAIEACETHAQYGDFLSRDQQTQQSFLCSHPGILTDVFSIDESFLHARTKWVDKSSRCQRHSQTCQQCTTDCGINMIKGDPACEVTSSEADNGESPRLMTCYNCCAKRNCTEACKDYHKRRCQPEQCSQGNLMEFSLEPSWDSSQDGHFFCPIEPMSRQRLLELEYSVVSDTTQTVLYTGSVQLTGDQKWQQDGVMEFDDGILSIVVNSSIGKLPNFLEGSTATDTTVFSVGTYKWSGYTFGEARISADSDFVRLRPSTPTAAPVLAKNRQDCTNKALEEMLLASEMENSYLRNYYLEAQADKSTPFKVINSSQKSKVTVSIPNTTRLLKKVFPPVSIATNSLIGSITHSSKTWEVTISGEVTSCPGYLHLKVWNPEYPNVILFECDTAIFCPKRFSITFSLPTNDDQNLPKDVIVEVTEKSKTNEMRIFLLGSSSGVSENEKMQEQKDSNSIEEEVDVEVMKMKENDNYESFDENNDVDEDDDVPNLPLPTMALTGIGAAIFLLLLLAGVGLKFVNGIPETPNAQPHHVVLAVLYMTFQFVYSICITGTTFFLILTVITSSHVSFILEHGQHGVISKASSKVHLLYLQEHLETEVTRQSNIAKTAQETCMVDSKKIVKDIKKIHRKLREETRDEFDKHRLDSLLDQQKIFIRDKLRRDIDNFRSAYYTEAQSALRRVNQDALASFQNIEINNTWLIGQRMVHRMVNLYREADVNDLQLKNFIDWTGIEADFNKLEIDLGFSLPSLPQLDQLDYIVLPLNDQPPIKRDLRENSEDSIRSIQIHNNWFFPLDESTNKNQEFELRSSNTESNTREDESVSMFYVFLGLFVFCDLILLTHRLFKAWTTTKLLIFGFPEYFRLNKEEGVVNDEHFARDIGHSQNSLSPVRNCKQSGATQCVKNFFTQTISTTFFPKMVGAVAACVLLSCVLPLSNQYLTIKELGRVGLYHSAGKYLDLQTKMANTRIENHAHFLNSMDFPAFQATVSSYLFRHQKALTLYHQYLHGIQKLSAEMYCEHIASLGITGNCPDIVEKIKKKEKKLEDIQTFSLACEFEPVVPNLAKINEQHTIYYEPQISAILKSTRLIVFQTSRLILVFLTIIVLKELLSAVLWIFISRSGAIRIRIIVEQES